ncbi:MAG: PqqD family protein [Pyrinomonadaceae bacterium]
MSELQTPKARKRGLVVQEMPGEMLVYDTETNKAHCLNDSAAFVWTSCNGVNTVSDIIREFEANAKGTVTQDFVWLAIDQLSSKGLLETKIEPRFKGKSRRDVLKTIGLASVAALPIIASLAAPQSALAATSCNCSRHSDCPQLGTPCLTNMCANTGMTPAFTCTA